MKKRARARARVKVKVKVIERAEGKLGVQANLSANLEILMGQYETLSKELIESHNGKSLVIGPLRLVVNRDHRRHLSDSHYLVASACG